MPVRLPEPPRPPREKKLSPLIRGSGPASFAPQSAAGRESPPRSRRALKKFSPAMFFGRRPSSNQRRATPYVSAIAPNSLSEGLHETPAGQRPASRVPAALLSSFPKNLLALFQGCKPCRAQHGATPRVPFNANQSCLSDCQSRRVLRVKKKLSPLIRGSGPALCAGRESFPPYPFRTSSIPSLPISLPSLPILLNRLLSPKKKSVSIRSLRSIRVNSSGKSSSKNLRELCFFAGLNPAGTQSPSPDLRPASFPKNLLLLPKKISFAASALFARASFKKITVPLDKGERARALRGKGVFAAVSFPHLFLSHPSLSFPNHPYPSC